MRIIAEQQLCARGFAIANPRGAAGASAGGGDKDVRSALRAVLGGRSRNFALAKLRPPGYAQVIAKGNYLPLELPLVRAQGIAAESPQDLRWQIRGLGAESPVFHASGICRANPGSMKNAL
jgi:hypothetical protein